MPRDGRLSNRTLGGYDARKLYADRCGACRCGRESLAHAMLQGHWRDNADLSDRTRWLLWRAVSMSIRILLTAAETPEINAVFEANTDEAIERSVFGSPTYFVDGDMFYGQDHLELVERARAALQAVEFRLIGAETQ